MNTQRAKVANIVLSSMLYIYDHLKAQGDLDPRGEGLNFLHWKYYPMDDEQKRVREHMDKVLKLITENNSLVSEFSIRQSLLLDFCSTLTAE